MDRIALESRSSSYAYNHRFDCTTALALFGMLGLIELLRDIIANVSGSSTAAPATGRRGRRSLRAPDASPLQEALLAVTPLLDAVMEVHDGEVETSCLPQVACRTARQLAGSGDVTANILAKLSVQVVGAAVLRDAPSLLQATQEAADAGRHGASCELLYRRCPET
ncbi:uncharacterized protein LOC125177608 [Hyalella azteca]|uniref:Uncharacterized protein LOC125177608 n=1 Tax=Hyalella azteca TaxID=294128 RepID=A0A979FG70_HYAAZ|nr:uncharacterized protein LOC125177608 [Hyalella azteca]